MLLDSKLHFTEKEWRVLPKNIRDRIKTSLTYANPKFAMTQRLGFSTHGIPREIHTYTIEDGKFSIARGEFFKIVNALGELPPNIRVRVKDNSVPSRLVAIDYVNKDFDLDERQQRCLEACSNSRQGIIHATTSAGKSATIMALIAQKRVPTLVIVPRKILLQQLLKDAKKWLKGCTFGTVMGGKATWGDVTFALERSLVKFLPEAKAKFGMVILDECHVAAASTFQKILDDMPARYRYGFTGTVKRKDGLQFLMSAAFGRIIAEVTKDELLAADRVSPVSVEVHTTNLTLLPEQYELDAAAFWKCANEKCHEDTGRMLFAKDLVAEIRSTHKDAKVVVASRHLAPLYSLGAELELEGLRIGYVTGLEKESEENCAKMEKGEIDVLLATFGCFSTGVNIPSLSDLILFSPLFTNELLVHQLRGRLMRKSEGKTEGRFHVMWDENVFDSRKLTGLLRMLKK